MIQQPCTLVFCWGAWGKDGAASKIPWWVVVSFSTQASCPRPLDLLHLPLFLSLGLGPATLFSLSWSAEPHRVSLLPLLMSLYSPPRMPPSPPFFLPNLSVLWEVFPDNTSHEFPLSPIKLLGRLGSLLLWALHTLLKPLEARDKPALESRALAEVLTGCRTQTTGFSLEKWG